ncbi:hypothetical protein DKM44_14330 [Deinococcus irradiatisoli]|uniref:Phospholipase D-like domain-containing protein n=1 Tax=Deinococcus irradiatisoli TaxID=2202254 RepID=A0A2Z3JSN1_9DEIO|nr:phospholipase D family protein [Deinococcus irradiatisoli]AWN24258.1 hypothetical protein DKM44_14330 [Deinococcus irradiatisoli]
MWSSWDKAIEQLLPHTGDWWLISPYITVTPRDLEGVANLANFTDVKVLTTADPVDFARGSSNLDVLRDMVERGAKVRAHDRLHAKVYLRRQGNAAVGWLGSANLTNQARHTNQEVMSGTQVLDKTFLQKLDRLWTEARRLDLNALSLLEERVAEERIKQQAEKAVLSDIVVLSIEERKAGKQFNIEHSLLKLGIDQDTARNIRVPAVSFIDAQYRDTLQKWRKQQMALLTRGKPPLMVRLPGGNMLYACVRRNLPDIEGTLNNLDCRGRDQIAELRQGSRDLLKEKFFSHMDAWRRTYGNQVEQKIVHALFLKASDEFDRYLASEVFGVDFTTLVPLMPHDKKHPWHKVLKRLTHMPAPLLVAN